MMAYEMDPVISIVTVSLDAAATIEDTIASVSLQRVSFGIEHICVDGGSKDNTRGIIDRWVARSAIPMISIYEADNGIFDAMNKGLKVARGEYVLFLNADDFLVSADTLSVVMESILQETARNPDVIVGNAYMGVLGRRGVWRRRRVPRLLGRLRGWGLYPIHQAQFTKRRLLEAVGGFDAASRFASDINQYYDLEYKMHAEVRVVNADVAFMRAGGAANAGLKSMYRGTVEIFRHLLQTQGIAKATLMVFIKSAQSVSELRYGRCPQVRWFAQ